ncbi:hypothetical protein [Pseudoroseomonas cervicalis]|uniref:hypothetical protein n=1 Tax=Teichococcus cervicalis TaxID=204525 RepID=UPI0022F1B741|nr:hypothetical protein [Pseudoroseomonas cervicalis]WBV41846.1 hypothetical protein PFY06_11425 [Pseudoroseomonas cervicalis]
MVTRILAASGGTLIRPLPQPWARAARLAPGRRLAGPAWPGGGVVVGLPLRAMAPEPAPSLLGDAAFIEAGNALAAAPDAGAMLFAAEDVAPEAAEPALPPGLLARLG